MSTEEDNNNNNSNSEIYILKKPKDVEESRFFKYGSFDPDTEIIEIYVNSKINGPIVCNLNRNNWPKNHQILWEQIIEYGEQDNDKKLLLRRFLNTNQKEILKDCSDKNQGTGKKGTSSSSAVSVADEIMALALENVTLFQNEFGEAHALTKIDDHYDVLSIERSRKFSKYLSKLYYDQYGTVATPESIISTKNTLSAKAEFEGETIQLHIRIAWSNPDTKNSIYYDIVDKKRRCIKITKGQGWKIVENQIEILFRRFGHQSPQVEPLHNAGSEEFNTFINSLNIKNESHKLIIKVWIISLLIPAIAHPILFPFGEKGSAKSTLLRKIRLLIDPSSLDLFSISGRKEEFIQQLSHHYLCFYDNVRFEPRWLSDESCRAVTGGAFSKRQLYSDDDDIPYKYKKILGFTGINVIFTQEDALDRSIKIELKRIDEKENKPDTEIDEEIKRQIPGVLGYAFDILSKTLEIKDSVQLEIRPRMADFAKYGEAISRALGHEPLEFLNAYLENIREQNIEIVESNPFAEALSKFLNYDRISWVSSPKVFIEYLREFADKNNIDSSKFPKNPTAVSRRLNRIRSNLREGLGIEVIIDKITAGKGNTKLKNTTLIKIRKIPPLAPLAPLSENQEENTEENSGGSGGSGALMSNKIPENIRRRSPKSDVWICNNCKLSDDIYFMKNHPCKNNIKNNFEKYDGGIS